MENPASWRKLERVIHGAIRDYEEGRRLGMIGASQAATIARALRSEGLVLEDESEESGDREEAADDSEESLWVPDGWSQLEK